jgi:flagellar biogenesis protein FliO
VQSSGWSSRLSWLRQPYAALSIVLVVMGLALLATRRWLPQKTPANVDAVQIIARLPLSPRQSAVLLHVGRQVVMVGLSGDRMQTLHVIDQPDEAALLLGASRRAERAPHGRFARRLVQEQNRYAAETADLASTPSDPAVIPADEASLRDAKGRLQAVLSNLRDLQAKI